jgi:Tol biopolymer transport system component
VPLTASTALRFVIVGGAAFVAVALGCILVIFLPTHGHQASQHAATPLGHVEAFASPANLEEFAEFSPDCKSIVFVAEPHNEAGRAIYSQATESGTPRRVTGPSENAARPAWSPDGTKVAYLRLQQGDSKQVVLHMLATGATTIVASLRGGPLWLCSIPHLSWAPDGTELYTSACESANRPCDIISIDFATGQVRPIIFATQRYFRRP